MIITKLKIKNLFGIKEYEQSVSDCELIGENGSGKTSVIDAIRYALTNRSERDVIIHNGSAEGYVYIETDTGLSINRQKRRDKADAITVKENDKVINKTVESFLRELFTPLQLNPVEFLEMDSNEQNRIILDLIEFKWDLAWIKEQFGEIVPDVDYQQNILRVLHQIQANDGFYFQRREDINREIRNDKAFIEDIRASLPANYNAEHWRNADLSELYTKLERARKSNADIEKAIQYIESVDNKVRSFEADKEIAIGAADKEATTRRNQIEQSIIKLEEQIKAYKKDLSGLEKTKQNKIALAEKTFDANVAQYKAKIEELKPIAKMPMIDVLPLQEKAQTVEAMKAHINEYDRMVSLQKDIEQLTAKSKELTEKIEKARTLPGEILQNCKLPIERLTIEEGEPRINGLPVNGLSDGEKLELCIDIAGELKNSLNMLLIDGVEKLSKRNRETLYQKCHKKGVQFIATRTTDDSELLVVTL